MRSVLTAFAIGGPLFALALVAAPSAETAGSTKPEGISLLQTLSRWQYPDSKPIGATMSDGGNPHMQSVKCTAVLTTADPVEKVVAFYTEKFGAAEPGGPRPTKGAVKKGDAKSVTVQDDSQGRPLTLRVFVVNKADTSTTLVVSRADDEKETHIAWSHYIRLSDVEKD